MRNWIGECRGNNSNLIRWLKCILSEPNLINGQTVKHMDYSEINKGFKIGDNNKAVLEKIERGNLITLKKEDSTFYNSRININFDFKIETEFGEYSLKQISEMLDESDVNEVLQLPIKSKSVRKWMFYKSKEYSEFRDLSLYSIGKEILIIFIAEKRPLSVKEIDNFLKIRSPMWVKLWLDKLVHCNLIYQESEIYSLNMDNEIIRLLCFLHYFIDESIIKIVSCNDEMFKKKQIKIKRRLIKYFNSNGDYFLLEIFLGDFLVSGKEFVDFLKLLGMFIIAYQKNMNARN